MTNNIEGIIFDMDGCLYPFDRGSGRVFEDSQFGQSVEARERIFIQDELGVDSSEAGRVSRGLKSKFEGHLSLGLESERGIPRALFFNATWDLQPEAFIDPQPNLLAVLATLSVRSAVLTAAPKIWADRVLDYLGVGGFFEGSIICGDQDIRKPDPAAFQQAASVLGVRPEKLISIGDQDHTDILPAKSLGMATLRIGATNSTEADFQADDVLQGITLLRKKGFQI